METDTITSEESLIAKALKENPPPDALPSGWIVRKSRSQPGTFFYYNQETGEARWEQPEQAKVSDAIPQLAVDTSTASAEVRTTKLKKQHSGSKEAFVSTRTVDSPAKANVATTIEPDSKRLKRSSSAEPKEVRVLHILKKHKGSRRPSSWRNPNITSTLEEAREELQGLVDVLQEVKDSPEEMRATFEELARTESDCSSAKRGGDLGFFGRKKMQPSFEQASFSLNVGEISDVVESPSGVHVILRLG